MPMSNIRWGIPGTKFPETDIKQLIKREERSLSEFIVTFHFISEPLASQIFEAIKDGEDKMRGPTQAQIFFELRQISPADVSWYIRAIQRFPKLLSARSPLRWLAGKFAPVITWDQYAKKLGYATDDFIDTYNGTSYKVEQCIKKYAQQTAQ